MWQVGGGGDSDSGYMHGVVSVFLGVEYVIVWAIPLCVYYTIMCAGYHYMNNAIMCVLYHPSTTCPMGQSAQFTIMCVVYHYVRSKKVPA